MGEGQPKLSSQPFCKAWGSGDWPHQGRAAPCLPDPPECPVSGVGLWEKMPKNQGQYKLFFTEDTVLFSFFYPNMKGSYKRKIKWLTQDFIILLMCWGFTWIAALNINESGVNRWFSLLQRLNVSLFIICILKSSAMIKVRYVLNRTCWMHFYVSFLFFFLKHEDIFKKPQSSCWPPWNPHRGSLWLC